MDPERNVYPQEIRDIDNTIFKPPIDLTNTDEYLLPHLKNRAVLQLADNFISIIPEAKPLVPSLQDYQLVNTRGMKQIMEENRPDVNFYSFLGNLPQIDAWFEANHPLPPGMAILRHGEKASVGRTSMPQLALGENVAGLHCAVSVTEEGLLINSNLLPGFSTELHLSYEDSIETPQVERYTTDAYTKYRLYEALGRLIVRLPDEEIDEKRDDLVIDGGFTTLNDCKAPAVELLIQKADDYPDLDALEGYDAKHIVIDPRREEGITVSDIPSPAERQHGITKAPFERQLSSRQAEQLLKLTAEIKYYAT